MSSVPQEANRSVVTTEERTMIRDYILLPHLQSMVQKSLDDIEYSTNVLKRLYLMAGQRILDQIAIDSRKLRQELKQRNIRMIETKYEDFIINHHYHCRGYQDVFGITRDAMKSEISIKLSHYISELARHLKSHTS